MMILDFYNYLISSETIKIKQTQNTLKGLYEIIPDIFDVLINLSYSKGKLAPNSDTNLIKIQDLFQFYIYDIPFKMRSILLLMEIGNYHDAIILYRTFVETYIYYKFYIIRNDGNGLSNYVLRKSKRSIKDIFEEEIPGFYDSIYGELCKNAHGDPLMQAILRGNDNENKLKHNVGDININWFGYVSNQLIPLVIGIIGLYNRVYPSNTIKENEKVSAKIKKIEKFIYKDIEERIKLYPAQKKMIEFYNMLINV